MSDEPKLPNDTEAFYFGPFTFTRVDLQLKKSETRIHLRPQAAKLLRLLLEHRLEIVSRTDIERYLWNGGPPPEIDPGQQINTCIRLIRLSLNDRAKAPAYIGTHNGGYQFIAPVTLVREGLFPAVVTDAEQDRRTDSASKPEAATGQRESRTGFADRRTGVPSRKLVFWHGAALAVLLISFGLASLSEAYGFSIVSCCLACIVVLLLYSSSDDTVHARIAVTIILIAVMAYIPSAATLAGVVGSVVNARTLPPATVYPFITGLKFIPLFVVVLFEWALQAPVGNLVRGRDDHGRVAYLFRGAVVLLVAIVAVIGSSGEYQIWSRSLPGFQSIAAGYLAVLMINLTIWLFAFHKFAVSGPVEGRRFLIPVTMAYLPLVLIACFVDQEYNVINLGFLDQRRPDIYFASNPDALEEFKRFPNDASSEIGPDLRRLLNDPSFARALRTQRFYKQNFDELFQLGSRSVMFGFKAPGFSAPKFMIIRFPEKVAAALRFEIIPE